MLKKLNSILKSWKKKIKGGLLFFAFPLTVYFRLIANQYFFLDKQLVIHLLCDTHKEYSSQDSKIPIFSECVHRMFIWRKTDKSQQVKA